MNDCVKLSIVDEALNGFRDVSRFDVFVYIDIGSDGFCDEQSCAGVSLFEDCVWHGLAVCGHEFVGKGVGLGAVDEADFVHGSDVGRVGLVCGQRPQDVDGLAGTVIPLRIVSVCVKDGFLHV